MVWLKFQQRGQGQAVFFMIPIKWPDFLLIFLDFDIIMHSTDRSDVWSICNVFLCTQGIFFCHISCLAIPFFGWFWLLCFFGVNLPYLTLTCRGSNIYYIYMLSSTTAQKMLKIELPTTTENWWIHTRAFFHIYKKTRQVVFLGPLLYKNK